jgi:sulfane dehydrogenase subunit SoxC
MEKISNAAPANDGPRTGVTRRNLVKMAALASLSRPGFGQEPRKDSDKEGSQEISNPLRPYGERSSFEKSGRISNQVAYPGTGSTRAPLQDMYGIITPSSLFFERLHSGIPSIDPSQHELLIDGLVDRPLVFTLKDLRRMQSVSRIYFIECSGNSASEHEGRPRNTPQLSHGLVGCAEWTGVPLSALLHDAGVKHKASWVVAEGADGCRLARSLPLEKALDDILVAYGQNGEPLRPEQGYPLRLIVPGWEGNVCIKWLSRIAVTDQPSMARDEASFYTDLLPNGKARQFTFIMEAKSVITRPAGGQQLDEPGFYEITGLAWSGRGRITRVQVSVDGGIKWQEATLQSPVLSKALTRFCFPWTWNGSETTIASRCQDETGYWQPAREQLLEVRGEFAVDHYNGIKWWRVQKGGKITYA